MILESIASSQCDHGPASAHLLDQQCAGHRHAHLRTHKSEQKQRNAKYFWYNEMFFYSLQYGRSNRVWSETIPSPFSETRVRSISSLTKSFRSLRIRRRQFVSSR